MSLKEKKQEKMCIVYVSTYPPRACGIGTFTADLIEYSDELFGGKIETKVVAMNTKLQSEHRYPKKVFMEISENEPAEYKEVAEKINSLPEVSIVCIQHEFGIFGQNHGENIIHFLENLKKPKIVTLHTVLPEPDKVMRRVLERIVSLADNLVVMTELSKKMLVEIYNSPEEKIKIIPHGIHPQLYSDQKKAKKKLKLTDKVVLTTFGLLSRGKGVEYAIQALPEIIKKFPNVVYLVLGETHPIVKKTEGEVYRNELINLAHKLEVEKNIIFHNKYMTTKDLLLFLEATDIYLALPQNPSQTVSGTLTYALGAGRPVISTSFMQAKEIVTSDQGILVPFHNHESIAHAVINLIEDEPKAVSMSKAAYFHTRNMTWPNVALSYMSVFSSLLPPIALTNKYMLPIKIDHLKKLTDDFGVIQFATLNEPDLRFGYTLDDNARALIALSWFNKINSSAEVELLLNILMNFIERSAKKDGGFINYFDADRRPHEELNNNENLEDANARALWALAVTSGSGASSVIKIRAQKLFESQLILHKEVASPRAAALYIKAFSEYYSVTKNKEEILSKIKKYADFLVDLFERSSDGEWCWFEESLNYSNAVLPEALLFAYKVTEEPKYFKVAKSSLDFLLKHSFEGDVCAPVGQLDWFKKGKKKGRYDQQPEEVSALVLALHQMILVDANLKYGQRMLLAFDWFLGNNVSRQVVYTHLTGGSYDGINEKGVNLNQGAESTISYLLARLVMETSQE